MNNQANAPAKKYTGFEAFVRLIAELSRPKGAPLLYAALERATHRDAHKLKVLMYAGREGDSVPGMGSDLGVESFRTTIGVISDKSMVLTEYLSRGLSLAKKEGIDLEGEFGVPETWRARYETKA